MAKKEKAKTGRPKGSPNRIEQPLMTDVRLRYDEYKDDEIRKRIGVESRNRQIRNLLDSMFNNLPK